MIDLTTLTDTEISDLRAALFTEQQRRADLARIPDEVDALATDYLIAAGRLGGDSDGNPADWVQPTGAYDAYPEGVEVTHDGKRWTSLVRSNVWEPGVSGWRETVGEDDAPPEWVQPTGAHDAYNTGDRVTFEGAVYESKIDSNTWSPTDHLAGWQIIDLRQRYAAIGGDPAALDTPAGDEAPE